MITLNGCKRLLTLGVIIAVGAFFANSLVMAHSWMAPKEAAEVTNPVKADAQSIQMGQRVFKQFCADCHGPKGRGDGPLAVTLDPNPADLIQRAKNHSDGDFFWKILNGRPPMPGFKDRLSENLIWHSINFIRSLGE